MQFVWRDASGGEFALGSHVSMWLSWRQNEPGGHGVHESGSGPWYPGAHMQSVRVWAVVVSVIVFAGQAARAFGVAAVQ